MAEECCRVLLRVLSEKTGAALYVGEEERNDAGRQLAHLLKYWLESK
jgi:hypothetical protein